MASLGDGGTSYTPTTNTQQFFDRVIDAACKASIRCGTVPDMAYCRSIYASLTFDSTAYAIDQGRATLNPAGETACLQAIANRPCLSDRASSDALDTVCQNAMVGNIVAGGDCIDDFECKAGLECDQGSCTASCCAGVCAPTKPLAAVGGACTGDSTCVATAYCDEVYSSATGTFSGTCLARLATGAACTDYGSCASNAQCVGATGSKTCTALAADGAPCASLGVSCANTATYCDPVTGTCQPRIQDNAPCVLPDAGVTSFISAGCFSFSECKNGVCTRLPLVGQACSAPDAAVIDECLVVGKCVGGFCQGKAKESVCTVAVAKAAAADAGVRD